MKSKSITVGLLWHSITSDNLGVGALTISQMAIIQEAARKQGIDCKFVVIGTRGATNYQIDAFEIGAIAEFALRAFKNGDFSAFSLLRKCDIVFDIGEGDSFADIYGLKRLTMQVLSKAACRIFGVPLVLSPQTIGPFNTKLGTLLGKVGLGAAKTVYCRDGLSAGYVQSLGYSSKLRETVDVAFALPFNKPSSDMANLKLGINVSGLMMHSSNEFDFSLDYKALIEKTCELMLAIPGAEVFLVPHVLCDAAEIEDDYRASQVIQRKFPALKIAPRFRSPSEAKSFISGLDFLTGARMHACIAAISSGVAVLPMAYSRKFNGLFSSVGYSHVLDCKKMSLDEGIALLSKSLQSLPELKKDAENGRSIAMGKLESYISDVEKMVAA